LALFFSPVFANVRELRKATGQLFLSFSLVVVENFPVLPGRFFFLS